MSDTTELAILPRASLPTILAADQDDVLGKLARELTDFEPDATTPQGRAEIGSKRRKVGEAKMDLVRLANSLTDGWRKQTSAVVAERKIIEDRMDQLRDEISAPLVEYNAREKRRTDAHEAAIREFAVVFQSDDSSSEIAELIDFVTDLHAGRDFEEFERKARAERALSLETLRAAYQTFKNREDEAEAAAIRQAEEAERRRLEAEEARRLREEQIAAEAAERAKREAEERAAAILLAEQETAARLVREAEERAAAQLAAAEALRKHQADEAARERREAKEALAKAEQDKRDAIAKAETEAKRATEQAELDRIAAIEVERKRAAKEQQRADYHRSMLQHVKNCGFGFIGPDPQPLGILQYELTEKIKYDEENFGDLLSEALVARDAALAVIQKSIDDSDRRHAEEAERARQKVEDEKRAANVAHQRKINREAADDLLPFITEIDGTDAGIVVRAIITAIAKNEIRNVRIVY